MRIGENSDPHWYISLVSKVVLRRWDDRPFLPLSEQSELDAAQDGKSDRDADEADKPAKEANRFEEGVVSIIGGFCTPCIFPWVGCVLMKKSDPASDFRWRWGLMLQKVSILSEMLSY
jgi:hypothetical protein